MAEEKPEDDDKAVLSHVPKVFALRRPSAEFCEMVITTTARQSHVYHLTYTQICLLATQAESARLNWPGPEKAKPKAPPKP